jgi:hypothetical protein
MRLDVGHLQSPVRGMGEHTAAAVQAASSCWLWFLSPSQCGSATSAISPAVRRTLATSSNFDERPAPEREQAQGGHRSVRGALTRSRDCLLEKKIGCSLPGDRGDRSVSANNRDVISQRQELVPD